MMMKSKEELEETSRYLKNSIEDQFDDMKDKVQKAGKVGLIIGGGLLAVWAVGQLFSSDKEENVDDSEAPVVKKKKKRKVVKQIAKSNFLSDSLKEQAVLFALGYAAKQLASFLENMKEDDEQQGSK